MKRTYLIIIALILLSALIVIGEFYFQGWIVFRKKTDTPKEFINQIVLNQKSYTNDSIEIIKKLTPKLREHEDFFENTAYFDSTELIVDTTLYSPQLNKLDTLVIIKNPSYRQLVPDKNHFWYYDATCYLGIKSDTGFVLSWIGPSFTNSLHRQDLSKDIRKYFFEEHFEKDSSKVISYNLNDKRFWDCPIWDKIEAQKNRKIEFEKMKKEHPENVYEPKRVLRE